MDIKEFNLDDSEEFVFSKVKVPGARAPINENKICLLDADYIRYHVVYKIFKDISASDSRKELEIYFKEEPAYKYTKSIVDKIFEDIKDPIIFCFSGTSMNTFRASLGFDKVYKGNRKKDSMEYDQKFNDMKLSIKYIMDNYVTLLFQDLEADDVVSALQCEDTYIMSKDKDLKQVPGLHYNWEKNTLDTITNDEAVYNLAKQLLMGDSTDNISGIPGCGPKSVEKILAEVTSPSRYIGRALLEYQKRFGVFEGTDMFSECWMLVKMRGKRGNAFIKKYQKMFDLKENILNELKKTD